jgi:hypothetical protein
VWKAAAAGEQQQQQQQQQKQKQAFIAMICIAWQTERHPRYAAAFWPISHQHTILL